jgi:hypothetical protein
MDKQKKNVRQQLWDKENTVQISIKLQRTTDADIIAFLNGKSKQTVIKESLRRMMKGENGHENGHDTERAH